MTCANCNSPVSADDAFCGNCGGDLATVTLSRPTIGGAPPAPSAMPDDVAGSFGRSARGFTSDEPNAHYLGQRLQYDTNAETFNAEAALLHRAGVDSAQSRVAAGAFFVVVGLGGTALFMAIGLSPLGYLWLFGALAGAAIVFFAPMFRRHHFVLSEWKLTLDGKGAAADAVFDHVAASLAERQAPVQARVIALPALDGRRYLQVKMAKYDAYVSCFAFGDDLYVGWTLWWSGTYRELRRSNRPAILAFFILPWIIIQELLSPDGGIDVSMVHQYDTAKALRECVHAATRDGVEAAAGRVEFRGKGTIGSVIRSGADAPFTPLGRD